MTDAVEQPAQTTQLNFNEFVASFSADARADLAFDYAKFTDGIPDHQHNAIAVIKNCLRFHSSFAWEAGELLKVISKRGDLTGEQLRQLLTDTYHRLVNEESNNPRELRQHSFIRRLVYLYLRSEEIDRVRHLYRAPLVGMEATHPYPTEPQVGAQGNPLPIFDVKSSNGSIVHKIAEVDWTKIGFFVDSQSPEKVLGFLSRHPALQASYGGLLLKPTKTNPTPTICQQAIAVISNLIKPWGFFSFLRVWNRSFVSQAETLLRNLRGLPWDASPEEVRTEIENAFSRARRVNSYMAFREAIETTSFGRRLAFIHRLTYQASKPVEENEIEITSAIGRDW